MLSEAKHLAKGKLDARIYNQSAVTRVVMLSEVKHLAKGKLDARIYNQSAVSS